MEINGEQRIAAPRDDVWRALNDPDVLRRCIPGCESLERVSETEFSGTVTAKVGPVKATFGGHARLSDVDAPNGYTLSGEGKGATGFAKGEASVRLTEDGAETVLVYAAKAQVGGKLAQVGSRLIDGVTRKLAEQFFTNLTACVASEVPAAVAGQPVSKPAAGGLGPVTWAAGLIIIVALLLFFFAS